jgi:hypothetical protein
VPADPKPTARSLGLRQPVEHPSAVGAWIELEPQLHRERPIESESISKCIARSRQPQAGGKGLAGAELLGQALSLAPRAEVEAIHRLIDVAECGRLVDAVMVGVKRHQQG